MKHPSILPLLLLALAACGGGDESSESAVATTDVALDRSTYAMDAPPTAAAASGTASGVEGVTAVTTTAQAGPAAQIQVAAGDTMTVAPVEPGTVPGMPSVSLNPMLIRTGRAVMQVDSLEEGIARVRALARRVGGIVGNTAISAGTNESRRAEMELRIPSLNFDDAVGGLAPIGTVQSVNVTAEDVGEEYTDVSARVANARRLETRLLDLLATRSGRLEEVLNLEREVARVREEIERYDGRLRYLRTRASISMLTLTLHEGQSAVGHSPGERPIRDAFITAWRSFIDLLAGLIASLGVLIPLGFLGYLGWRAFRWIRRREEARDAVYRETLRRERERNPAPAPVVAPSAASEAEEPVGSGTGTTDY